MGAELRVRQVPALLEVEEAPDLRVAWGQQGGDLLDQGPPVQQDQRALRERMEQQALQDRGPLGQAVLLELRA